MRYSEFDLMLYNEIQDLSELREFIKKLNQLEDSQEIGYLTNYLVIRSCGIIEQLTKTLIYCHFNYEVSQNFVSKFLDNKIRIKNSANPSQSMINGLIDTFDDSRKFNELIKKNISKAEINQFYTHIDSLRQLRNSIAHGDKISTTWRDVMGYFDSCIILMFRIKETLVAYY